MVTVTFLLMLVEIVVGSQAVADQHSFKMFSERGAQCGPTAIAADDINGGVLVGEIPQPPARASDPPTGFVDMDDGGSAHLLHQLLIRTFLLAAHSTESLGESARTQAQTKVLAEHRTGFAQAQALVFVEVAGQCQRPR